MSDNGDQYLRDAGIRLPCAKQFGFFSSGLHHCDRPYGHTGPHTAGENSLGGGRDVEDEARTRFVLDRIYNQAYAVLPDVTGGYWSQDSRAEST